MRLYHVLLVMVAVCVGLIGALYVYSFFCCANVNQILLRSRVAGIGSEIPMVTFAQERLEKVCFEPIGEKENQKEILGGLENDPGFFSNYYGDRTSPEVYHFLFFTGPEGPKYAMVQIMYVRFTNTFGRLDYDTARDYVAECWPITAVTIKLVEVLNYKSRYGAEPIHISIIVNNAK